jgi:hypothetical protein
MADALASAQEIASQILLVPASWFYGPEFIINLVFPLLTTGLFFYMMLSRKLKIFRNTAVNLALGYVLAFVSIPFLIVPYPYANIFVTVFGIVTFLGDRITGWRLLIAFVTATAAWALATYGMYLISMFFH